MVRQILINSGINLGGIVSVSFTTPYGTPRVGLEPTSQNQQGIENKELTEKQNPVLSTSLDNILQKYPEIKRIITAWPKLPKHTKAAIKALIQAYEVERK